MKRIEESGWTSICVTSFLLRRLKKNALKPLFSGFSIEYNISRIHLKQDGLKLNGAHKLLVYADCVKILGGNVQSVERNTEIRVDANKESGLQENTDKTKYIVMSRDPLTAHGQIIVPRVHIFGNNFNESKLYSRRNKF